MDRIKKNYLFKKNIDRITGNKDKKIICYLSDQMKLFFWQFSNFSFYLDFFFSKVDNQSYILLNGIQIVD